MIVESTNRILMLFPTSHYLQKIATTRYHDKKLANGCLVFANISV